MKIKWFGHCTFLLQDTLGRRIITDPFDINFSQLIINYNPQLVLFSNTYNNITTILESNNINYINSCIKYKTDFIDINSFSCFQDTVKGLKRGKNIVYKFTFDNINIVFLGYLGHMLNENEISKIKNTDILFIPIGGHLTIDGTTASNLVDKINPKIIIPMHFKSRGIQSYLNSTNDFIFNSKKSLITEVNTIDNNLLNSLTHPTILLLNPYEFI